MSTLLRPWQDLERVTQEWRLSVVTPAASPPVTVSELKQHARLHFPGEADPYGGEEDDALLQLINAALQEIDSPEGWLGRAIMPKTLRLTLCVPPPTVVRLPGIPVASITSIVYYDTAEEEQTVLTAGLAAAGFKYDLDDTGEPALLWNESWPATYDRPDRIKINYVAGYADEASVPALIKQWVLIRAATLYRDREGSVIGTIIAQLEHVQRALDNLRVRM